MRNPKNKVNNPSDFVSNPGTRYHTEYSPRLSKSGVTELVPSGKVDIKQRINAYKECTDIAFMLRAMAAGDRSVLTGSVPVYGDFTRMPKTMVEAMQADLDAEKAFYQLPLDVRDAFGNNYRYWLSDIGSEDWKTKMKIAPTVSDEMRSMNNNDSAPVVGDLVDHDQKSD